MKKKLIYSILTALVAVALFFASCTKENQEVTLPAKLTTSQVLNITSNSATVTGFIVAQGNGIIGKGVCYDTAANPTVDNNKIAYTGTDSTATYNVDLSNLHYATTYYVRAYGLKTDGTYIYGKEFNFTTEPIIPTVTTDSAYATSGTSAMAWGTVTANGGAAVTARGVCYDTVPNPTISANKTVDGNGMGAFVSSLSKLEGKTTYYVRAYATNSAGTAYGSEIEFTTPAALVTLYIAGDYQGWNPAGATDSLMNNAANPIVRGYADITTTGGFKFTSQRNWNGPNYGAGATAGSLSDAGTAGNLNVATPGYYWFHVDLANMTYTALLTNWGVIGSATTGGWGSDQAMTYCVPLKTWIATIPLSSTGTFKFRANSSWDAPNPNYGSNNNDGTLQEGGSDIPVANTGTYSVIMNLSQPLNYTYALTTWSIIGSSTPGGNWSTDIDLVPNTTNNTWSVTAVLTAGQFKFRANHDWGTSIGASGTGNELAWNNNGANIDVPSDGTYTITLDFANGTYSLTSVP